MAGAALQKDQGVDVPPFAGGFLVSRLKRICQLDFAADSTFLLEVYRTYNTFFDCHWRHAAMQREPFDFKAFAADRSTRNSQMSNELGKAAAQAVMLINGGAAAAILSFMKGTQANNVFFALGLVGYAAGVICAAWMMDSLNQVLYGRSEFWQSYFNHEKLGEPYRGIWKMKADIWLGRKNGAFVSSVGCFLIASFCMAIAIYA